MLSGAMKQHGCKGKISYCSTSFILRLPAFNKLVVQLFCFAVSYHDEFLLFHNINIWCVPLKLFCFICLFVCSLQASVNICQLPGQIPAIFLARFWKQFVLTCILQLREMTGPKSSCWLCASGKIRTHSLLVSNLVH